MFSLNRVTWTKVLDNIDSLSTEESMGAHEVPVTKEINANDMTRFKMKYYIILTYRTIKTRFKEYISVIKF